MVEMDWISATGAFYISGDGDGDKVELSFKKKKVPCDAILSGPVPSRVGRTNVLPSAG